MSKIKCTVAHSNLFLSVDGKLQRVPKDSSITVDEKVVRRHIDNGNLKIIDDSEAVEVGNDSKKELLEKAKTLNITGAGKMKVETLKEKIAEAEAAIAEANKLTGQ